MLLGVLATAGSAQFLCPTETPDFCVFQVSNAASESLGFVQAATLVNGVVTDEPDMGSPLPNSSIAQGSFFAIYGKGLGPSTPAIWNPYPLPVTLGGTSVAVTINGTKVAAYPEYASSGQVNAVMPSNTPTGTGTLTVTFNGATTATIPVTVTAASFGMFTYTGAGTGPGALTNAVTNIELNPFYTAKPSTASTTGDYVTIWGTGLGPVPDATAEQNAAPAQTNLCPTQANCPVTVWVAGQSAQVTYAGRSQFTAVDQIDFVVPQGVQGCYVQVAVQIGSVVSNFTSMPVDPAGGTCQDADGIHVSDLVSALQKNGKANVAAISLLSNYLSLTIAGFGTQPWDNDTVTGEIVSVNTPAVEEFQGFALAPSSGNCTVQPFLQYPPATDPVLNNPALVTFLDAGTALSIQGTGAGQTAQPVAKNKSGNGYGALVGGETIGELIAGCPGTSPTNCAPYLLSATGWQTPGWTWSPTPGTLTVSAPGGSDVGAFSIALPIPSADASFKWNQAAVGTNISRSNPLTITWTGGDTNGYVDITLISSTFQSGQIPSPTTPGILAECIAPNSAGSFTVPVYVLQSLPSNAGSNTLVPPGELLVGPVGAPVSLPAGQLPSGLDAAYIFYHYIAGSNVTWQ